MFAVFSFVEKSITDIINMTHSNGGASDEKETNDRSLFCLKNTQNMVCCKLYK